MENTEIKRTKVEVKVGKTVQLYQYEPYECSLTSVLECSDGIKGTDIKQEAERLTALVTLLCETELVKVSKKSAE